MLGIRMLVLILGTAVTADAFMSPCTTTPLGAGLSINNRVSKPSHTLEMLVGASKRTSNTFWKRAELEGLVTLRASSGNTFLCGAKGKGEASESRSERAMRVLRDVVSGLPQTGGYTSVKELFTTFDKDRSGGIDIEELRQAFRLMGATLSQEQLGDIMHHMDVSGDGLVDWGEFEAAMEMAEAQLMEDLNSNDVMNDDTF